MIELIGELRTCDAVRALGTRGVGEGPSMDYKESVSYTARGTLTAGAKKELAKDISALANAQGGLLVIGVRDPGREGEPPAPKDFIGVSVWASPARADTLTLRDPSFFHSILLEVGGTPVAQS
jgi:hypothetical protein